MALSNCLSVLVKTLQEAPNLCNLVLYWIISNQKIGGFEEGRQVDLGEAFAYKK